MARRTGLPAVEVLDACESTNDEALRCAHAGASHGAAVAAVRQTLGRGRRGHVWVSPPGGLYLSVALRPGVARECLRAIPVAAGLGALDACRALGATAPRLKWPNDLVVPGPDGACKLGGILVELCLGSQPGGSGTAADGVAGVGDAAVCGIGVNLSRPQGDGIRPQAVRDGMPAPLPAAYLDECGAPAAAGDYAAVATLFRDAIVRRVDAWAEGLPGGCSATPLAPVLEEYHSSLLGLGSAVVAVTPEGAVVGRGTFFSVDGTGRAVLALPGGGTLSLAPEQASLRPAGR
ncbi:biotin--[acetyl-CoA-carboxylase] ligase [Parafannyhessea umbonata]|uniref:biotin--[acetyl-CoA-carboxylase] ligase n=1 Tax=Parafannyhessea umbonata TaxID=604330 RepID=UPI002A8160BA|nr:biotin--[acetyl-CoA-carboxylase] ligase [Parafannyhessea umbonata]MDY4014515.1 biotin--[acetyl-CoA-carboxylase] ligase [Parafannyhessea umbonata]